jgi:hypothetical protein
VRAVGYQLEAGFIGKYYMGAQPRSVFLSAASLFASNAGLPFRLARELVVRFLGTPFQAMHQPTNMILVIPNSKLTLDQFRNSGRGPQIGWVTMGDRSLKKQIHQVFSIYLVQLRRTAGRVTDPQSLGPATPAGIPPAHHRTGIASDASPYLVLRTTRIQQR